MNRTFPTIGQYNQHFLQNGNSGFQMLRNIVLKASKNIPIKIFLFGSGAYAAVFKGLYKGETFAVRCFLTIDEETISRYKVIGEYLSNISSNWKVDFQFLDNELLINSVLYPIIKMEWVDGQLLNDFITQNIHNNSVLEEIQRKLIIISKNLKELGVGHGDLQFGNIMVEGNADKFTLRLIDYDGMYVPNLRGRKALEYGRSEFQHPRRNADFFNPQMDRFSFWVMLTGLEALKHDKTLWQPVMQGGYNTLDNCLFISQDFTNPNQSDLFQKLQRFNNSTLNFYLEKLKEFCSADINSVEPPCLYGEILANEQDKKTNEVQNTSIPQVKSTTAISDFKIDCLNGTATVLSSTFEKIGQTPLLLNKTLYKGKTIIISNGEEIKQMKLNNNQNIYEVSFLNGSHIATHKGDMNSIPNKEVEIKNENRTEVLNNQIEELERKKAIRVKLEEEADIIRMQKEREELNILKEKRERSDRLKKLEKERKEIEEKRVQKNWIAFLIVVIVLIGSFLIYKEFTTNKNTTNPDSNSESTNLSVESVNNFDETNSKAELVNINYQNIIRNLLKAEEQRNFNEIFPFFSRNAKRYWDIDDPNYSKLKKRYEYIWGFTSNSKNKIEKIIKVNSNTFDLYTNFSYYNNNKEQSFETNSIIRYVFDNKGKIFETYGIEQNIQEKDSSYKKNEGSKYGYIYGYDVILRERPDITAPVVNLFKTSGERIEIIDEVSKKYNQQAILIKDLQYYVEYEPKVVKKGKAVIIVNEDANNVVISFTIDDNESKMLRVDQSYIEKLDNKWYKVENQQGNIGWVYSKFVTTKPLYSEKINIDNSERDNNDPNSKPPTYLSYKYKTKFDAPLFEVPLRNRASIGGLEIYKCPKTADVYVIDNLNDNYYKVYVNGYTGYLNKSFLKRKY